MNMIQVDSSAIHSIGYDAISQKMQIRFTQGKTYIFCLVPQKLFDELLEAPSKGIFYDEHIRNKYPCPEGTF